MYVLIAMGKFMEFFHISQVLVARDKCIVVCAFRVYTFNSGRETVGSFIFLFLR